MPNSAVLQLEQEKNVKTLDTNVEQQQKEDSQMRNCSTCKKDYKSNLAFSRHLLKCKNKINECYICETDFQDAQELKVHHIDNHDGQVFVCLEENCFGAFSTKKGLTYHTKVDHSEKGFDCETCVQSFSTQEELNSHHRSANHKAKSKQRVCKGCGKSFNTKHDTDRHFLNSCPFNPERVAKCRVCNVNTGKASDFLEHLQKKHNSTSEFLCTRCLLDMPCTASLEDHLKTCKKTG